MSNIKKEYPIAFDDTKRGHTRGKEIKCPKCGQMRFQRYFNYDKGEYLPEEYGKCQRKDNCGYWNQPDYEEFLDGPRATIPPKVFFKSINRDLKNNLFIKFLISLFGRYTTNLLSHYHVSDSPRYKGGVIFWYLDVNERIRTGKVIGYDIDGHRIKGCTNWVHHLLYGDDVDKFNLKLCFFGEHLLSKYPDRPVAIVESEKTAIICEGFIPDTYNWISCGSSGGMGGKTLNVEKCKVLQGREVVLFPDMSPSDKVYHSWRHIARMLNEQLGCTATVDESLLMRNEGNMRRGGCDLADYLIDHVAYNPLRNNYTIPGHLINMIDTQDRQYMPF